jgi:hypothetical protein
MPTPSLDFITYELTEAEETASHRLTDEQRCMFQNLYMQTLMLKGNLTVDTKDLTAYIQQEACYNGQLQLIRSILDKDIEVRSVNFKFE